MLKCSVRYVQMCSFVGKGYNPIKFTQKVFKSLYSVGYFMVIIIIIIIIIIMGCKLTVLATND